MDRVSSPYPTHRRRAEVLRERHPFAAQVLAVYLALLDVWEDAWELTRDERPTHLAAWATDRILPRVVKATEATGPEPLVAASRELVEAGRLDEVLVAWLAGGDLPPVERYLARASLCAPLLALGEDAGAACTDDPSPRGDRRCPSCGGPPQLSFRGDAGDRLVSGRRQLVCARCSQSWNYSASSCPSCGETSGARRTVYAERRDGPVIGRDGNDQDRDLPVFPHLRVEGCTGCGRYLIDVDLGRDPAAVPEVDELVALPLDLYASEHSLSKITPNLMGF